MSKVYINGSIVHPTPGVVLEDGITDNIYSFIQSGEGAVGCGEYTFVAENFEIKHRMNKCWVESKDEKYKGFAIKKTENSFSIRLSYKGKVYFMGSNAFSLAHIRKIKVDFNDEDGNE